jgi:hypothetical protein
MAVGGSCRSARRRLTEVEDQGRRRLDLQREDDANALLPRRERRRDGDQPAVAVEGAPHEASVDCVDMELHADTYRPFAAGR